VSGFERLLRGPRFSGLLLQLGIDSKRYWLLMDLFGTLTERRETLNQLGRDGVSLKILTVLYGLISILISLAMAASQAHLRTYLLAFLGFTAFVLVSIVIPEISNSLINPVEGLILSHQPINGATYTSAKLSHLVRILLYLVPAVNLVPALAGVALREARWYYPLEHMLAAVLFALLLALASCGIFGWLIRFVPAPRLKAAGQVAEFLPMLGFFSYRYVDRFLDGLRPPVWFTGHWQLQAALASRWSASRFRDFDRFRAITWFGFQASCREGPPRRGFPNGLGLPPGRAPSLGSSERSSEAKPAAPHLNMCAV